MDGSDHPGIDDIDPSVYAAGLIRQPDDDINEQFYHRHVGNCRKYNNKLVKEIQAIYIILAIIWILIVFLTLVYRNADLISWGLILIPFFVFAISYYYTTCIGDETEELMSTANYTSFAFLVSVVLINWGSKKEGKGQFFRLIILGFILIVLSTIDIWVPRDRLSILNHFRSGLQTLALIILSLALYQYYTVQASKENTLDIADK